MPDDQSAMPPSRLPYMPAVPTPVLEGPRGLRFDFNEGCRVLVRDNGLSWRLRLSDLDTGNTLFDTSGTFNAGIVRSAKRYYIRFRIEAWEGDELVFAHDYDARDRDVLIQLYPFTMGDGIGWFPNAARFQEKHGCRLTCAMSAALIPLFREAYPHIAFVAHDAVDTSKFYASYIVGVFYGDLHEVLQPTDFRMTGLHRSAAYTLGLEPDEAPPRIALSDAGRPIAEPYVCIATQATGQGKYWNNPNGWSEIVAFLKASGYSVVCIDQRPVNGNGIVWNHIPHGVDDQTGDHPLQERARWLHHADFFVGLSSGLSWLAWAVGVPVVMISGFTHPITEFKNPYRVINFNVCNSCWNDPEFRFDQGDYLGCPRHRDTPANTNAAVSSPPNTSSRRSGASRGLAAQGRRDPRPPAAPRRRFFVHGQPAFRAGT
ncbi:MAG TPA: autotransporter strand-loop-strand O-heptosyltransferase [Stellaceae bacterium]|jgi:autotransporter strand-loop-strand O-heptosyltransferase